MRDCRVVCFLLVTGMFLVGLMSLLFIGKNECENISLRLVHVVMRHGDRNPELKTLYPTYEYRQEKFYPEGYAQLTPEGQRTTYNVGVQLRKRYNSFLPEIWKIYDLEARSTDYDRTKMSLLALLAGLYPPAKGHNWLPDLNWQPIPYNYVPKPFDKELLGYSICPKLTQRLEEYYDTEEYQEYFHNKYNELFEIIEKNTNQRLPRRLIQGFYIYDLLITQQNLGNELPKWSSNIYPDLLMSLVHDFYNEMLNGTENSRVSVGYFLKRLTLDTEAKINNILVPLQRKMFIYSVHEMLINLLLNVLGVNQKQEPFPKLGSYLIFELHQIDGVFGIKMFYQNYKEKLPELLKIQGCESFCPYDHFYELISDLIPDNDEECFGNATVQEQVFKL